MIIPSIDLEGGSAVQLIGGKEKALDAGDPRPIAEVFGRVGEIAVIDLDAAKGLGENRNTILDILNLAPCRVGGGIRDYQTAKFWLDAGAQKIIIGTAAKPELLKKLPSDRVIVALDALNGDVVVEGWTKKTGLKIFDQIEELSQYVGGFLVTFVEREGKLVGIDKEKINEVVKCAKDTKVTIAGGIAKASDIGTIDKLGADTQVGMALYTKKFDLADSLAACLRTDRSDGLWPTVVTDEEGLALGLAYSNIESLRDAIYEGRGTYYSRSRDQIWIKGGTSGAKQVLKSIDIDCDRDAIRFSVNQSYPGFCHLSKTTCWGDTKGIKALENTLSDRRENPLEKSYANRLFSDKGMLNKKIREEAGELCDAINADDVIHESADVIFFTMVAMSAANVSLSQVQKELDRRALKITRRSEIDIDELDVGDK